jgi:hypothetical protein
MLPHFERISALPDDNTQVHVWTNPSDRRLHVSAAAPPTPDAHSRLQLARKPLLRAWRRYAARLGSSLRMKIPRYVKLKNKIKISKNVPCDLMSCRFFTCKAAFSISFCPNLFTPTTDASQLVPLQPDLGECNNPQGQHRCGHIRLSKFAQPRQVPQGETRDLV